MNSPFASRRKPRKIGHPADDETQETAANESADAGTAEPVVKRPTSSRPRQKSKLRLSFGPGGTSMVDDDNGEPAASEVITPKRHGLGSSLGRRTLEKSALQRSSRLSDHLPVRVRQDGDRPSYSAQYLKELRVSTPSTPKSGLMDEYEKEEASLAGSVDVAAKFGESALAPRETGALAPMIPSEAEIREKKARRARLAKEQDYISMTDSGEADYLDLETGEALPDTRLVRDDENFAEGFDDYVEDGKISLGHKAERAQKRKEREQMRELIEEAEALSDEEDSDLDEKAAYEAAQTRAAIGNGGLDWADRSRTPPKMTSLPRLAHSLERLRLTLAEMEQSKTQMIQRMEELRKEKADIAVREVEIQALLKEAGDNYERLKIEAGLSPGEEDGVTTGRELQHLRGLESLGVSLAPSTAGSDEND